MRPLIGSKDPLIGSKDFHKLSLPKTNKPK